MLSKLSRPSKHFIRAAGAVAAPRALAARIQLPSPSSAHAFTGGSQSRKQSTAISAAQAPEPPFPTVIVYNQSKHASQSVIADIRAVWKDQIRIIQTIEQGLQRLPNVDGALYIGPKRWGDLPHFEERLKAACAKDHSLHADHKAKRICFMAGWSAFAESAESARAIDAMGLFGQAPNLSPVTRSKRSVSSGFAQT
jgi:hypothetical protein